MRSQVSAQSLLQLEDLSAQSTLGQLGQFLGVVLAGYQLLKHFARRDSGDIADHALKFDVCALQGLLQLIGGLSPLASQRTAVAGQLPQVTLLTRGNEAGLEQAMAQQIGAPRGILNVSLSSRQRLHVGGVDHDQLKVGFKQIIDRHPEVARGFHGRVGDPGP